MKKTLALLLIFSMVLSLCACGHEHTWLEATCTEPKTCSTCGETEGDALGHTWQDATCTEPKTCSVCGATEGDALGHTWQDATCTEPKTCSVCGATEGEPNGHTPGEWIEDDSLIGGISVQKCTVCGETIAEKEYDRSEKTDTDLFAENGFKMSTEEFQRHLICYLPEDTVICVKNVFDDSPWFDGQMFSLVSADMNQKSRYIRMWYCDASDPDADHIDAYFSYISDFEDIAEYIFEAIDPEYAHSADFQDDLNAILRNMKKKNEKPNSVEMTNCCFVYTYIAPYKIGGTNYPGYFEIRFVSKAFYREHYVHEYAYFPMNSYKFIDAYNKSKHAFGTLKKDNNTMRVKGTNTDLIIFVWDVSETDLPGGMWTIPDIDFNALMVELVSYKSKQYDTTYLSAITMFGQSFAEIFDPTFDCDAFVADGNYSVIGDYITMTYSHNGFEYKLEGRPSANSYYYYFTITLSANNF